MRALLFCICISVLLLAYRANARTEPGRGTDEDGALKPRESIDTSKLSDLEKQMATEYNMKGLYLTTESSNDKLRVLVSDAAAVLSCESGGHGFTADTGLMILRFENHIFYKYFTDSGQRQDRVDFFNDHYKFDSEAHYKGHFWRREVTDDWMQFHGNQTREWEVIQFSQDQDDTAALMSASYGTAQIMGFNHELVGFDNVQDMFLQFSRSIRSQLDGLFSFIANSPACLSGLQTQDYVKFASCYNGAGQASVYASHIVSAANAWISVLPVFPLQINDRVAFFTRLALYDQPSTSSSVVRTTDLGDRVTIVSNAISSGGYTWYAVSDDGNSTQAFAIQGRNNYLRIDENL
eukprot:TRINITY_DN7471_c0_g1_i1.p1 TRINITY_DN7471_c0_g1~~TRINITY_DN7471_c0_g1_i1.p1  ORF type:complete len:350 (+),score=86.96 TRINITY_DN7471_c0_g1_i1:56-1105(+)